MAKDGYFLKRQIYTLKVPQVRFQLAVTSSDVTFIEYVLTIYRIFQVDGGAFLSVKIRWSQKLLYHAGQFSLSIPFSFPACVNPVAKKILKREKILLNVNTGIDAEVLCQSTSHPLKVNHFHKSHLGLGYT